MSAWKITLKNRYLTSTLNSEQTRAKLQEVAEDIGSRVYDDVAGLPDVTVDISDWTSDRAVVQVALNSVRGVALEAKYGYLRHAAESAGLDVNEEAG